MRKSKNLPKYPSVVVWLLGPLVVVVIAVCVVVGFVVVVGSFVDVGGFVVIRCFAYSA